MLYLEDFLEMIEQLPSELRDRSTEMRMLDLQVQRGIDQNNKVIAEFFQQAPSLSQEQRDQWYMKIKEDFQKIRDQAEEKVSIADAMYSLVEKYHNRLTREVMHFKYELEADSPGITETIERKLQEAERANIATRRERKRKAKILEALQEARASAEMSHRASTSSTSSWNGQPAHNDPTLPPPPLKLPNIKRAQTFPKQMGEPRSAHSSSAVNLSQKAAVGANGGSYDPPKASQVSPLTLPTGAAMPAFTGSESRHGRPRKLTSRVQEMLKDTMHRHERTTRPPTFSTGDSDEEEGSDDGDELEHEDAKRTWCICNQKSFGDMVACDNKDCPFEWFHYHCVGIKEPPKGKWFCPHCTEVKLRKNAPVV